MKISKEVKVGLLALVAGVILYVGFNFLKGIDFFSPTRKYFVVYGDVGGLTVSNPVTLNGMTIGRVASTKIMVNRNNQILVTLEVNDDIVIGDGTFAMLKNSGILGGKEISLIMKPNTRSYNGGDTLKSLLDKDITAIISEKALPVIDQLDTLMLKLNGVFNPKFGRSIQNTMENVEAASGDLKETLSQNKGNITKITSNLSDLSASLNETEKKFKPIISKLDQLADSLNDLQLKRVVNNANLAMKNIQELTAKLNGKEGTLGMLVNDKKLYENINKTTQSLDSLIEYFNYNPRFFLRPLGSKPGKHKRPQK